MTLRRAVPTVRAHGRRRHARRARCGGRGLRASGATRGTRKAARVARRGSRPRGQHRAVRIVVLLDGLDQQQGSAASWRPFVRNPRRLSDVLADVQSSKAAALRSRHGIFGGQERCRVRSIRKARRPLTRTQSPPRRRAAFFAFLWACTAGMRPYILLMTLCTAVIGAFEALLFAMLGRIVDWLARVEPAQFWVEERGNLLLLAARAGREPAGRRAVRTAQVPDAVRRISRCDCAGTSTG